MSLKKNPCQSCWFRVCLFVRFCRACLGRQDRPRKRGHPHRDRGKGRGGKTNFETEYSGPIEIQVGKVKQIFTDNPVEVHLKSGEILKGKLRTLEDGKLAVEPSAERQATTTELQSMASVNPPPKPKWNGSLTVGQPVNPEIPTSRRLPSGLNSVGGRMMTASQQATCSTTRKRTMK